MAIAPFQLTTPQEITFRAQVLAAIQAMERLGDMGVEVSSANSASLTEFIGPVLEMKQVPFDQTELDPSQAPFSQITSVPIRFALKTAVTEAQSTLTGVNILSAHSEAHGFAGGRLKDSLKITSFKNAYDLTVALHAANLTNFVVPFTVGPRTGLNSEKTAVATALLNARGATRFAIPNVIYNAFQAFDFQFDENYKSLFQNPSRPLAKDNLVSVPLTDYTGVRFTALADQTTTRLEPTTSAPPIEIFNNIVTDSENIRFYTNSPFETRIVSVTEDFTMVVSSQFIGSARVAQIDRLAFMETKYTNGKSTANT